MDTRSPDRSGRETTERAEAMTPIRKALEAQGEPDMVVELHGREVSLYSVERIEEACAASDEDISGDPIQLAMACGAVSFTPPPMRAVRGVSMTFEQLNDYYHRIIKHHTTRTTS